MNNHEGHEESFFFVTFVTFVVENRYFARPLYPGDSIWTFHAALRPTM